MTTKRIFFNAAKLLCMAMWVVTARTELEDHLETEENLKVEGCPETGRCKVRDFTESLMPRQQCPIGGREDERLSNHPELTGLVSELNETCLSTLLETLRSSSESSSECHVAVLYYASWCPFSRSLRPIYEAMAALHPHILHVAVEEQRLRPSVLSRVGVHSFPALHIHNRTGRIKYQGARTLGDLQRFYANITGTGISEEIKPENDIWVKSGGEPIVDLWNHEPCPYPWAQHPQQLLQENMCLVLASAFVFLRVLCWVGPKTASLIKSKWGSAGFVER